MSKLFALRIFAMAMMGISATSHAHAQTTPVYPVNMMPPAVAKLVDEKKMILIDIRTPEEWKETGVAANAHRLDMTDPMFLSKLSKITEGSRTKPVALICRTANRTRVVQNALMQGGYSAVINVEGGMIGNAEDKGWIKHGLPMAKAE